MSPLQVAEAREAVAWAVARFRQKAIRRGVEPADLAQAALEEVVKAEGGWSGTGSWQAFAHRVAFRKVADEVNVQSGCVRQNPRAHVPYLEIAYEEAPEEQEPAGHETWCATCDPEEEIESLRQAVISRELGRAFGPGAEEAFQLLSANGYEEPARERRISRQALYERVQRLKRVLSHSAALKALWEDL